MRQAELYEKDQNQCQEKNINASVAPNDFILPFFLTAIKIY
jgi:hypothetical protein